MVKASGAVGRALEEKTREVNARFDALTRRRDELQAELTKRQLTDEAVNAALSFRQDVVAGIQDPTFETKRRVLEMLGVQVKIEAGTYRVNCRVGTSQAAFDFQTSSSLMSQNKTAIAFTSEPIDLTPYAPSPGVRGRVL